MGARLACLNSADDKSLFEIIGKLISKLLPFYFRTQSLNYVPLANTITLHSLQQVRLFRARLKFEHNICFT